MTTLSHDIRAKQSEREQMQRQLDEWLAAGNVPQVITQPARASHMLPSHAQANQGTWGSRK